MFEALNEKDFCYAFYIDRVDYFSYTKKYLNKKARPCYNKIVNLFICQRISCNYFLNTNIQYPFIYFFVFKNNKFSDIHSKKDIKKISSPFKCPPLSFYCNKRYI